MTQINIDFTEMTMFASLMGATADQIPFAMSLALNQATENTRSYLIRTTWPGHVQQRNKSFIAAALSTRDSRANKGDLRTEIFDRLGRGNLMLQATGGTRVARAGTMAIPSSNVPRGAHGVPTALNPRNIDRSKTVRTKDRIFWREKNGRLRLLYTLKRATPVPKPVPFYQDYGRMMREQLIASLPAAIHRAMSTRRVK